MTTESKETLQKALLSIRKLKQLLKDKQHEPIAIIGLSCRFPQAKNKDKFWELLTTGKNTITRMPEARWDLLKGSNEMALRDKNHPYWGSYLTDIDAFDAYFFGISPREAKRIDPQHRLFLEVAYEAFEDAGIPTDKLAGSNTGVFASLYANSLGYLQDIDSDLDALYIPTGNAVSVAANRLSYLFDLRGPSIVLDTACSSSLVAIHLACLYLQNKLCDTALVAGANINIIPSVNALLHRANMLSPDGQCKTFDANANGYVQGEGIASVVLKPLSKALQDKDRIYAVIQGCVVNQDGKTNGLTAPNGLQQEKLLKQAYATAQINPQHVSYIECHGTGTVLGDPIELQALSNIIGKNRNDDQPCWIGSVKTNIGHLEPAAGLASLIKVALALKYSQIPPHLNYSSPNPHFDISKHHLKIPQSLLSWPQYNASRVAGISGFGFGGTNAHIILREAINQENQIEASTETAELFTLSAKNPEALNAAIQNWINFTEKNPNLNLSQICYNLHVRRSHYSHRLAIIATNVNELILSLHQALKNPSQIFDITPSNFSENLKSLANDYINQTSIDWFQIESTRSYPHIDMPLYSWQHQTYWPPLANFNLSEKNYSHPFQGEKLSSPLNELQFSFQFNHKSLPEIADTNNILHAGFYLEMLAFVADEFYYEKSFTIENLIFQSPIIVPNNKIVTVQLILTSSENDITFDFYSNTESQSDWKKHATGKLILKALQTNTINFALIKKIKQSQPDNEQSFYNRIQSMMMPYQGSIRCAKQYWKNDQSIVCDFREPSNTEKNNSLKLKLHFGMIDACIQGVFLLLPADVLQPYVASKIERLQFFGHTGKAFHLFSTFKSFSPEGDKFEGSWTLINENNEVLIECENIQMTQLGNKINIEQINRHEKINLATIPQQNHKQHITDYLLKQTAHILSMPETAISLDSSLRDLGMDSLMALVLIQSIETEFGLTYSLQQILQGITLNEIIESAVKKHSLVETNPEINSWIMYRKNQSTPKIKLFCLPYGGGGASIYRDWQMYFPNDIEVCPIQLPGRENRINEAPINNLTHLVDEILHHIQSELTIQFAFFGHSFGSLLGFELIRQLRKRHLSMPIHFFASAYPDPRMRSRSLENMILQLKQKNINLFDVNTSLELTTEKLNILADVFLRHGFIEPAHEKVKKEIIQLMLPIFIADIGIVKNYQYIEEQKLDIPMTVFIGMQDTWVPPADHLGWRKHTSKNCDLFELQGGHLFIKDQAHRKSVISKITIDLEKHHSFSHRPQPSLSI